ncbi:MAG: hypothetical protein JSV33_07645 [bacterium]|nr:MAG: hypothetical protein JSV33_07645 [bacterium]
MRIIRLLLFFLSIQFFLYNMGLLGRRLSVLASAVTLLLFVALSLPERERLKRRVHIVPALLLVLALVVISRGAREGVLTFPLLAASFLLLPGREDHAAWEREALALAGFLFASLSILAMYSPAVWYLFHWWGLGISRFAGRLIGQDYLLGQTATGVPILLGYLSYHAVIGIMSSGGGFRYFLKTLILLLVLQVVMLALLTPLAMLIQLKGPSWDLLLLNPEVFFAAIFLVSFMVTPPQPRIRPSISVLRPGLALACIACACAILLSLRSVPGTPGGTVLLYDKGYMNWRTPVYGRYGHKSGGMFGYLPKILGAAGCSVKTVNSLDRTALVGADAVVVINVLEYFSEDEKEAITEFVRDGGALLALGDHTGVQGIRGPFNDLLDPYNIEFIFDSATFFSKGWGEEAVLRPHPITHGLHSPAEMDIWVGASLSISPPAHPVVVAKYGYSDIGSIRAIEFAYLGNRIYDPGEQLGDLVLVAGADFGKGRVLVFGDTSSFQNSAMVSSHRFVVRVLSWLVSGTSRGLVGKLILPIVIAAIAILVLVRGNASLAGIVSAALLVGMIIGMGPRRIERSVALDIPNAVIDLSHFERFDQLTWYDDCTGGLQYNLMRAGYFPLLTQRFNPEQIERSDIVVIIAPVKPFTEGESEVLDRFMEGGGWILYTCGAEERGGSHRYLGRHGLEVLDIPLTNFTATIDTFDVRVNEGWVVEVTNGDAEVMAEQYGYPFIVRVRKGRGGMIFIADSSFLLNRNLEGMETYYAGNIDFLRWLFSSLREERASEETRAIRTGGG